jgi:hypothetical protein
MFRLLRVIKLVNKSEGMVILLQAIMDTFKDLAFFSLLLTLFLFICTLVGMDLFAYNIKINNYDDGIPVKVSETGVYPRLNFNNFGSSFLSVFALLLNEDWNYMLYTYVKSFKYPWIAYTYILFVVLAGNFVLL